MFKVNKKIKKKKKVAAPQIKKNKITSFGKALEKSYHIYLTARFYEEHLDKNRHELLNSLSNFSLAKTYYSQFRVGHCGCSCFYFKLWNNCLQVLIKRGAHVEYLSYNLFDRFQEAEEPTPFFERFCEAKERWCEAVYGKRNFTW